MKTLLILFLMGCFYKPFSENQVFDKAVLLDRDTTDIVKQQYSHIKSISTKNGTTFVTADYVQFLFGKKAVEVAQKYGNLDTMYNGKGNISSITVNKGYYILNENKKLRQIPLTTHATINILSQVNGKISATKVSAAELAKKIPKSLFLLSMRKNRIIRIEEVFVP